jgi:ferritin
MDATLLTAMAAHIASEEKASRVYRSLSAWCEWQSWPGCAAFFRRESCEEYGHTQEWQDYVLDRNGMVAIEAQNALESGNEATTLLTVFSNAFVLENIVLSQINELSTQAATANDWDAVRFMHKYTEAGVKQIRDLTVYVATLKRAAADMAALQAFDREMAEA